MNASNLKNITKKPHRVCHSYTQSIHATPDVVFPLLCPIRELEWTPGWHLDWVISDSGVAEQSCVFQTPGEENTAPAIWFTTQHHSDVHEVEYIKIIPKHTATKLQASLESDGKGGTLATIAYEYTALGPEGERFVDGCTEDWYLKMMLGWESAMNHYLATGKMAA